MFKNYIYDFFFRKYPASFYIFKWLLISTVIGVLVGSATAGFLQSLDWVTNLREKNSWLLAFLPLAGLFIGFLYHYLGKKIESGNNLLIDTINNPKGTIPFRMAPFVYLSTIITHLFGGSAGREGTALQIAGAISDQFSKPFKISKNERQILIIASIAAGFGAVFGTPLAGAIFALEVFLIGRIKYNAIFPAFAAAIIANVVTKLWNTHHSHFEISAIPEVSWITILYAIIAGIIFGICAAFFSKSLHFVNIFFKNNIKYPPLRPFVGGIVIALSVWLLGTTEYIGLGIPNILKSFQSVSPGEEFILKIIFTVITLGSGFKGGEVTPLFFIGATLGSFLSLFIPLPFALLASMGFISVLVGATNTPLAGVVMGLEIFGNQPSVYIAIAAIVAYLLSGNTGIYKSQLLLESKHSNENSLHK
jgi:H+/Cl- antiporter ClcA